MESVRSGGVNQPALVQPREDGAMRFIAGHRRQRASELAGFMNMSCIVRGMTDDEAILAMTDDNHRHRETDGALEGPCVMRQCSCYSAACKTICTLSSRSFGRAFGIRSMGVHVHKKSCRIYANQPMFEAEFAKRK